MVFQSVIMIINLITLMCVSYAHSVNILYICPVTSTSHHIWNTALTLGLIEKGHNITMLTHNDEKSISQNFHIIEMEDFYNRKHQYFTIEYLTQYNPFSYIKVFYDLSKFVCEHDFKTKGLATLNSYPKDFKFDLIIFDITFGQCLYPLVDRFNKPPVVAVTPFLLPLAVSHAFGNPLQTSYMPLYSTQYTDVMSLKERFINFILVYADVIYRKYIALPAEFELARKYFGTDTRPLNEIEREISILLANTDFNLESPIDVPPNIIPVGGLHIRSSIRLPEDIQQIANRSEGGFIVFSMGSILNSKDISKSKKEIILRAFAKLKRTVFWKIEDNSLKNVPNNVILTKWLPQNDLLAHPNAKLLISHGGALSSQEAMYHGVPVVAIPVFADQIANAARMERKKIGKTVQYEDISEESFYQSVKEVLDDPMYRHNIKTLSKRYRDKLNTPLETAVFWIEYILRHGGGEHLNLASRDMSFFETHSLDIYAILLLSVYAIYSMIRLLLTCFKGLVGLMFDRKPIN